MKKIIQVNLLILILYIKATIGDISDEECGIFDTEIEKPSRNVSDNATPRKLPSKDYKGRPRPNQKSLLIVFDGTSSMTDDLAQLRPAARNIIKVWSESDDNPIFNYVLAVFRDPEIHPFIDTKDPSELYKNLNTLTLGSVSNMDCAENSLFGLKVALEKALPNSLAYVITDASAKDYTLYDTVARLIQQKQVKVDLLLTGNCHGKDHEDYKVFSKIATVSGGQAFDLTRDNVENVLSAISDKANKKYETLISQDFDSAGKSSTQVKVDISFKEMSVSLSGTNAKLSVTDKTKKQVVAKKSISYDNIKIMTFDVADSEYNIEASADSSYSIRAGGISDLKLEFGFSTNIPDVKEETSFQPLAGFQNHITIFLSDYKLIKCLTKVMLIPANNDDGFTQIDVPLERVNWSQFSSNRFEIPQKKFKVQIYGYDSKGTVIDRIISGGIESIKGGLFKL